jgi:hypothetical protein
MNIVIPRPEIFVGSDVDLDAKDLARLCTAVTAVACNSVSEGFVVEDFKKSGYVRSIRIIRHGDSSKNLLHVHVELGLGTNREPATTYVPSYLCQMSAEDVAVMSH